MAGLSEEEPGSGSCPRTMSAMERECLVERLRTAKLIECSEMLRRDGAQRYPKEAFKALFHNEVSPVIGLALNLAQSFRRRLAFPPIRNLNELTSLHLNTGAYSLFYARTRLLCQLNPSDSLCNLTI
jgi:hypothetical protein